MHSGIRHLQIHDPAQGASFPCIVQYPTLSASAGTRIGPYDFDATIDAPMAPASSVASARLPVCLISHGGGGSHLLYRTIGTCLARHGYIVASPEHPGDNRNDRSLSNTDAAAVLRPRQVSLTLDAIFAEPFFQAADASRVGMVGHSMGGYTALALVGGHPWSRAGRQLPVAADSRIRAAVLLAPATDWYRAPGALGDVHTPLLAIAAEHDTITPPAGIGQALALSGLPQSTPVESTVVPGAGHFSFLAPFPASMRRPGFAPASDPEGFDREQFHRELPLLIHDFLTRTLNAG